MLAEVLEQELVAPEDKDIRAVTEVDVQERGHTRTEGTETTERPAKKKRGGHAQVKTECLGENPKERRAAIRSTLQPGYYICLWEKADQDTAQNWEHATRCQTWITWSMLTLGRPSRPPPTLMLCASSVLGRTSPTRTSRRTHRPHLPRLVKLNKSDVRLTVTKPDTCRTRVPKR